jgi:MoxR-like ATPase
MEERQVTADGNRMPLGDRFMVVATQNPVEFEGTYPLPEAQLDRFLLKLEVSLPDPAAEAELLRRVDRGFDPLDLAGAGVVVVVDRDSLTEARAEVAGVTVSDGIIWYASAICQATRTSPDLVLGASPRGAIALIRCAKAMAACSGRDYVVPEDIKDLTVPALRHRLVRRPEAEMQGVTEVAAVERAVARVPVPR